MRVRQRFAGWPVRGAGALALVVAGATLAQGAPSAGGVGGCQPDATAQIQARIDDAGDGSIVDLPDGCFLVETIRVTARDDLVIDGSGTTLQAASEGGQSRIHVLLLLSSHITIRGLKIIGSDPTPGTWDGDAHAFQHGFAVNGSTDVLIENVNVSNVYGDGVAVQKASSPAGAVVSERVTVRDSTFAGAGRQGVSVSMGKQITLSRLSLSNVGRSAFDLEPDTTQHLIEDVTIEDNTVSAYTNFFVASQGVGCQVRRVSILRNTFTGGGITMKPPLNVPAGACHRQGVTLEGNVATLRNTDPNKGAWAVFGRYDDVTVGGNVVTFGRGIPGVYFSQAGGLLEVVENQFCGAARATGRDPATTGTVVEVGNTTAC